ncbi:hypothetical protein AB0912_00245 [Streptomyces sp. NPDC007084]|uniref:hypothetical protein n=1 Tax=Streptomyces sp. NPDC007084 TaxID=3154313 RepID=UPI0034568E31
MPTTVEAPRSADEAAHLLAREGRHVHLVSEGESHCLKGACGPVPVELPSTVRERARLIRLSLSIGINRL